MTVESVIVAKDPHKTQQVEQLVTRGRQILVGVAAEVPRVLSTSCSTLYTLALNPKP